MKIAIIGSGAIGGYFGARLHKAGHEVHFLARGKHLAAMKAKGLQIQSILGDFSVYPIQATDKLYEIGKADLILIAVKSEDVKSLAAEIASLLHEETAIIPLQNGVLAYEELTEIIEAKHVLGGTCRIISKILEPGLIKHFAVDPIIHFGEWKHQDSARIHRIGETFVQAGIRANPSQEIQVEIWKKFIIVCTSALLAVSHSTYGQLLEIPETRNLIKETIVEIHSLAKKMNLHIDPAYIEQSMEFMDSFAYDATASLARDIWEGRPSELEYQNGSVVKLAEKYGVEVPLNRFLYHILLPREKNARTRDRL